VTDLFFLASKLFEFVGSPTRVGVLLLVLAMIFAYTRRARLSRRLMAASAVLLTAVVIGPLGHFLAVPLETRFPRQPDDIAAPDGVVVLGGSVDEALSIQTGRITFTEAAERLTAAVELRRRFPHAKLVFSGGSAALSGSIATEAEIVKRFWRSLGADEGDATYEDRSRNTYENALFTRDLVKPNPGERWLLITSAMHMPRAMGVFRKVGFEVTAYPVDYRTDGRLFGLGLVKYSVQGVATADFAAHEWIGLVVYWLTGRSAELFPGP